MRKARLSVLDALREALPVNPDDLRNGLPSLWKALPTIETPAEAPRVAEPVRVSMTFCPDPITTT